MATPYCPSCDALTLELGGRCKSCGTERPVEGWPQDALIGRLFLDTYTVIKRLGSGGFGVVYLAENAEFGARRAIKVLDSRYLHNDAVLRRFRREAKALYKLQSPYTVRVERWGRTDEGHYYLVMELAEGETLRQLLDSETQLDERRALSIVRQTAVALADAHSLGILHRDLKPENLVIREHPHEGDRVAVLDFGISKILGEDSATHRSGLVGTPSYMAPECWNPALGPQDIRSDLWSLGIIAFEMLVGALPFEGDQRSPDPMTTAFRIANMEADEIGETLDLDAVHSHSRKIVMKLLARDPRERYQNPESLLADIERHPLWATIDRKSPGPTGTARKKRRETADTVPNLPASRLADTVEAQPSAIELDGDDDLDTLSFQDEPPEYLHIRATDEPVEAERRRGPSIWPVIAAVVALGVFWLATDLGGTIFGLDEGDGRDAGGQASTDGVDDAAEVPRHSPWPATIEGADGMTGVLVPGGAFTMGVDAPASLIPAHTVTLDAFHVDEHAVTVGMWGRCVQRGGCPRDLPAIDAELPGCVPLDESSTDDDRPVNCLPWNAADQYCRALGRRLPSEAEWERAARLGAEGEAPQLAGTGLREWVYDWYSTDYYDVSPALNPTGSIFGTTRVVRGGAEANGDVPPFAVRSSLAPDTRDPGLTFRCVRDAGPPSFAPSFD